MKTLMLLLLVVPTLSFAAVKPESAEGRRIVHQLASTASDAFVAETAKLLPTSDTSADAGTSCESAKEKLAADFETLELDRSKYLRDAKAALDKSTCAADGASVAELQKAQTSMFNVTLLLRTADSAND